MCDHTYIHTSCKIAELALRYKIVGENRGEMRKFFVTTGINRMATLQHVGRVTWHVEAHRPYILGDKERYKQQQQEHQELYARDISRHTEDKNILYL